MATKLSITIVVYKKYDDVINAISSLEKWTDDNIKKTVYIVDNGVDVANPIEREKFLEFISSYNDVEYLEMPENVGFGKGHNYVIPKLDSEYHAILNPDVVFLEDVFGPVINWMEQNQDVGMVIPKLVDDQGNLQNVYRRDLTVFDLFVRCFKGRLFKKRYEKHVMCDMDYSKPFQVPFAQGSFMVIRTSLFKQLKGFDERYFMYVEDTDLSREVNNVSKVMYFPYAKAIHKWERGSHRNFTLFKYHIRSIFQYFKKWGVKWF